MSKVKTGMRKIELLAPAKNKYVGIQAILHGADAVYIGASTHGARKSASNSVQDIAELVDFAHQFRAKVYVTVNTLVYEEEIKNVTSLIWDLYHAGVDALIVQDMGILRMNIPPIELHASTQCDIRTPQKAKFLEDAGFSQLVLARELTLSEIRNISDSVSVPLECFVHGALCVSYSGRCNASYATSGRSANRGECSQVCRLPFTLKDADGKILSRDKHLLSLRDFNATGRLAELLEAGVSSFKIEGRLKDASYVKNITAWYRQRIDEIIALNPDKYYRASVGESNIEFFPNPNKSFNRGFTDFFLSSRRPIHISSPDTPKSMGEPVSDTSLLRNGDGIAYFDKNGQYTGAYVNGLTKNGCVLTSSGVKLPRTVKLRLTYDKEFEKKLEGKTAIRKIGFRVRIDKKGISAWDERGNFVRIPLNFIPEKSRKLPDLRTPFQKTGNTIYRLDGFESALGGNDFIPAAILTAARREILDLLHKANLATYPLAFRRKEKKDSLYPSDYLIFSDNVSNSHAESFYREHGVKRIQSAMECTLPSSVSTGTRLMTTRHCILRELGKCLKNNPKINLPLSLTSGKYSYGLEFDCAACEMHVLKK